MTIQNFKVQGGIKTVVEGTITNYPVGQEGDIAGVMVIDTSTNVIYISVANYDASIDPPPAIWRKLNPADRIINDNGDSLILNNNSTLELSTGTLLSFINDLGLTGLSISNSYIDNQTDAVTLGGTDVKIQTYNTTTQVSTWTYSANGTEILPGGSVISEDETSLILSPVASSHQWAFKNNGDLQLSQNGETISTDGQLIFLNPNANGTLLTVNGSGSEIILSANTDTNWAFSGTGLTLPGGATLVSSNNSVDLTAGTDGLAELASNNENNYVKVDNNGAYVITNWTSTSHTWTFGMDGVFSVPGVEDDSTAAVDFFSAAANNHKFTLASDWTLKLKARADGANEGHLWLEAGQNTKIKVHGNSSTIDVETGDGITSNTWTFDNAGVLTIPNTVKSKTGNYYLAQSDTSTEMSWQAAVITTSSDVFSGVGSDGVIGTWIQTAKTDEIENWVVKSWNFGFDGKLTLPSNSTIEDIPDGVGNGGVLLTVGSNEFKFDTSGASFWPNDIVLNYGSLRAVASDSYDSIKFSDDGINDSGSISVDTSYNMYLKSTNNFYIKREGIDRLSITPTDTILSGNVTFSGPVTFNGTATYVLSTNTIYTDNILELHTPPGGTDSEWTVDDGMDIGLRFRYYNGQNLNGGLVLANDTKYLEWYEYGVEANGNITSGVYGTFKTAKIELIGLTSATSTLTGTLKVSGGVGVGGSLYASALYDNNSRVVTAATLGTYGVSAITAGTDTVVSTATGSVRVWNNSTLQSVTDRGFTTTNAIYINNATASASTLTGALRVAGGVGVGGSLYASALNITSGATIGGSLTLNAGTANQLQYLNASKVLVGATNLTFDGTILTGAFSGPINGIIGGTTPNTGVFTTLSATGITSISNAVAATSTSTGALKVTGGVGVGGSLYATAIYDNNSRVITTATIPLVIASTGISITSVVSTITTFTISNTGVLQLTGGTDISVSTSTGNITINDTSTLQSVTDRGASSSNAISITNATAATSTNTGALVVTGGVGIGGSLYAGNIYDNSNRVVTSVTPTASTGISITSVVSTGTATSFTVSNTGVLTLTAGTDISVSTSTGNITINDTSTLQSVTGRGASSSNAINITNTTSSTNTSTGALKIAGGVGVGGSLYAGQLYDNDTRVVTAATAGTDTSVSVTNGNISVWNTSTLQTVTGRGATTNQAISITNTTSSTNTSSGALTVTGGVGVGGGLYADRLYDNGNRVLTAATLAEAGVVSLAAGTGTAISTATGAITVWSTASLQTVTSFGATTPSAITITNATASTSTISGALTVTGGIGAGNAYVGSLNVTGVSTLTGNVTVSAGTANQIQYLDANKTLVGSSNLTFNGTTLTGAFSGPIDGSIGGITPNTGAFTTVSANTLSANTVSATTVSISGVTTISNTSTSNSTSTGALTVAGGVGVGGSLYAGNIYDNNNRVVTSVTPSNGPGIVITSLVSTGTATSFIISNSGVITLTAGTDTAVSSNVGGTVRVWNNSTLQTISDRGSTTTNAITINNSTSATSTNTGALTVTGGVGVGGSLYAGNIYDNNNRVVTSVTPTAGTGINIASVISTGTATSFTISNIGVLTLTAGTDTVVTTSSGAVIVYNNSTLQSVTDRGASSSNAISITNTTNASSTTTGALKITGGVGVGGKLYASNIHSANTATFTGPISLDNSVGSQGNLLTSFGNSGSPIWSTNLTWDGKFINIKSQANYWSASAYYSGITIGNSSIYANTYDFSSGLAIASNGSFDGVDWKYLNDGYVNLRGSTPDCGSFVWYMSEYGTTGQYISDNYQGDFGGWRQMMALDSLGNLTVLGSVSSSGFIDNSTTPENSLLFKQNGYITGSSVFNISNDNFIRLGSLPNYWNDFYSGSGAYTGIINGLQTFYSGLDETNNNTGIWVNAGWNDYDGDGYRQVDGYVAAYAITDGNHNWQTGGYGLAGSSMSDEITSKMYLTNAGLLGIGTYTNLTAKLTVQGTMKVSSTATLNDVIVNNLTVNGNFNVGLAAFVTSVTPTAGTGINITSVVSTGTATSFTVSNTGVLTLTAGTDTVVTTSSGAVTVYNNSTLQSVTGRGAASSNAISITNTTTATSTTTGALTVTGGVGVGGNIYAGKSIHLASVTDGNAGEGILEMIDNVDGYDHLSIYSSPNNPVRFPYGIISLGAVTSFSSLYANSVYDNSNRVVTSVTPNAGTGIEISNIVSNGTATSFTVSNTGVLQLTGGTDISVSTSTGNITINDTSTLQSVTGRGATTPSAISITNTTDATNTTTGALTISGGIGANSAYFRSLDVSGPTTFGGAVTFNGTATYVLSTNTIYTDNLIELHTHPNGVGGSWTSDDLKDVGIRFHYFDTQDRNGALVLANDTKYLEWYSSGAESNTGTITGGVYGTFKTGSIRLVNTTTATSTTTGALTVTGGIGAYNAYITALTVQNDSLINGLTIGKGNGNVVSNTVFGKNALNTNTTGANNVAIGVETLSLNSIGDRNTAIGWNALYQAGRFDLTVSGYSNNTGNTAIGYNTLSLVGDFYVDPDPEGNSFTSPGGNNNIAIGYNAASQFFGGNNNVFLGGYTGQTGIMVGGSGGVAYNNWIVFSDGAGNVRQYYNYSQHKHFFLAGPSSTESLTITASTVYVPNELSVKGLTIGRGSGNGTNSVAIGTQSLYNNVSGNNNTAIGNYASQTNDSGNYNTAIGYGALSNNQSGSNNVAIGYNTLSEGGASGYSTSERNTAIGNHALGLIGTFDFGEGIQSDGGDNNIAIGYNAASQLWQGSNNVFIGGYTGQTGIMTGGYNNGPGYNNWIVLSDGAGNVRQYYDYTNHKHVFLTGTTSTARMSVSDSVVTISTSTAATSTTTGALVVTGGVGVGGSLYASNIYDNSNRVVTSVTPTAGTGIGIASVVSTGTATSFTVSNTGVLQLTGGTDISVSTSTGNITIDDTSTLQSITGRGASSSNAISITNTTAASSTTTGALIVTGGIGANNIYATDINATRSISGTMVPRFSTVTTPSSSTFSWNSNNTEVIEITALDKAITLAADSGTPYNGQKMTFRIKDNGTARNLTWTTSGANSFRAIGVTLPSSTVVVSTVSKLIYVGCMYNSSGATAYWDVIAVSIEA